MISNLDCLNIVNYLKNKKEVLYKTESDGSIKFYVNNKIFAIVFESHSINQIALRFKPEFGQKLRQQKYIIPSLEHMNSFHWSSIFIRAFDDDVIFSLIDLSYELTIDKMTKKQKFEYEFNLTEELDVA